MFNKTCLDINSSHSAPEFINLRPKVATVPHCTSFFIFLLLPWTKNFSFCANKCHKKLMKRIFFLTSRTTNYYEFLHKQLWHLVSLANLLHNECILHQTILHFHWKVQKHSGVTWNFCNSHNSYKWVACVF